jgi:hypothetical protein
VPHAGPEPEQRGHGDQAGAHQQADLRAAVHLPLERPVLPGPENTVFGC